MTLEQNTLADERQALSMAREKLREERAIVIHPSPSKEKVPP